MTKIWLPGAILLALLLMWPMSDALADGGNSSFGKGRPSPGKSSGSGGGAAAPRSGSDFKAHALPTKPRVNPDPAPPSRPETRPPGGRPGGGRPGGGHGPGPRPDPGPDPTDALSKHNELRYGMKPTDSLRYGVVPNRSVDSKKKRRPPHRQPDYCRPYCDTTGWYGYYDYEEYDDDEDDGYSSNPPYQEPETFFSSGGVFERFDPYGDGPSDFEYPPPSPAAGRPPNQTDLNQYEQMMRAW